MISRAVQKTAESASNVISSSTDNNSKLTSEEMRSQGKAISSTTVPSNSKLDDLEKDMLKPSSKNNLTSDFGVKNPSHDIWLSASTQARQGPQLLEDGFSREKV